MNVVDKGIAKRPTDSTHLKKLFEVGVLNEVSIGKYKLFIHPKLMQVLNQDSSHVWQAKRICASVMVTVCARDNARPATVKLKIGMVANSHYVLTIKRYELKFTKFTMFTF